MNKHEHVRTQLQLLGAQLGLEFRSGEAWVRCPFHGNGQERTPSCKITVDPARGKAGFYYCFGCRHRPPEGTDHWDHFANTVGLVAFRPSQQVHDTHSFSFMACEEVVSDRGGAVPNSDNLRGVPRLQLSGLLQWPEHTWRTINPDTMRQFDARVLYRHNELNAYFPVWMNRNYVGGVYAAVSITDADKAAGKLAYVNTSGTWANDALFGYHLARRARGWLWAVEGPRDTAKVVQLGGRAVGLLSAHVSTKKIRAIEALDPPGLIVALDPDSAGDRGRTKLHAAFDGRLPVLDVHFPEGKDPAKMTPVVYARILQQLGLTDGLESHHSQRSARRPQSRSRESLGC